MNAALLGCLTAVGWGGADFAARFSGRALGHFNALLGMLIAGSAGLMIYAYAVGMPLVWETSAAWLLMVTGVGIMVATLLLYQGLARGPIGVVAPIVGGYPALSLLIAFALGSRPTPQQWIAIAVVVCGVLAVARYAPSGDEPQHGDPAYKRKTIVISVASALAFAVIVLTGQAAARVYGDLQTTLFARLIGLLFLIPFFFLKRDVTFNLPIRWWPLLGLQAGLDSSAYVALFAAGNFANGEFAAVTASTFGAITVVLARLFLKESMSIAQWLGIIAIFSGVGVLSL